MIAMATIVIAVFSFYAFRSCGSSFSCVRCCSLRHMFCVKANMWMCLRSNFVEAFLGDCCHQIWHVFLYALPNEMSNWVTVTMFGSLLIYTASLIS